MINLQTKSRAKSTKINKNIQFFWFFIQTFIKRHKKDIALGFIFGFFAALFILQVYPFYIKRIGKKHKKIGIVGRFTERNLPFIIRNQISLGLMALTPSGEATPSLVTSWETDQKKTKYTFRLRSNTFWQDGKKFTASDINYKLKDVVITPIDKESIQIVLKEPFTPLLVLLSKPLIRPGLIGLGAYKVKKLTYSADTISSLILQPRYEKLPVITYKFYPNLEDAVLGFKRGEVNALFNISSSLDLKNWKSVKISEVTLYDRFIGLFFNMKNNNFKEKEIRQAFAYAIPLFENQEKAYTPISPLSWAYSQKIRLYKHDLETAKKIFSESSLASPSSQLTITTFASLLPTAQAISNALNNIGVNTKIKVENSIPADYEILLLSQIIPPDPDQYQYWQSTQENTNITNYNNLKIDKLLEDGRKTLDKEKRKEIYADFQRYLVDDAPVIFLYHPKVYNMERE